jgi:hypothetical protein
MRGRRSELQSRGRDGNAPRRTLEAVTAIDAPSTLSRCGPSGVDQWEPAHEHGLRPDRVDLATDEFLAWVGLDDKHRRARAATTFCLETSVTDHREGRAGDPPLQHFELGPVERVTEGALDLSLPRVR